MAASGALFLDSNAALYSFLDGGAKTFAVLDAYANYAKSLGYRLAVTDVVLKEMIEGPLGKSNIVEWLAKHGAIDAPTGGGAISTSYGSLPDELRKRKSIGDMSIVGAAKDLSAKGYKIQILSDDEFFTKAQNLKGLDLSFRTEGV